MLRMVAWVVAESRLIAFASERPCFVSSSWFADLEVGEVEIVEICSNNSKSVSLRVLDPKATLPKPWVGSGSAGWACLPRAYLDNNRPRTEDRIVVVADIQRALRLDLLKMKLKRVPGLQINKYQALFVRIAPIVLVADLRDVDDPELLQRLLTLNTSENLQKSP